MHFPNASNFQMQLSLFFLALAMVELATATTTDSVAAPHFRSNARRGNAVSFRFSLARFVINLPNRVRWAKRTTSTQTTPSSKASSGNQRERSTA